MKRGNITIAPYSDKIQVFIELSEDGTVWMSKNEIRVLFNTKGVSLKMELKALFKSGELIEDKVKKEKSYTLSNGQKCIVEYFNLEAIIALSFRIKSHPCTLFRQWITNQVTASFRITPPMIDELGKTAMLN